MKSIEPIPEKMKALQLTAYEDVDALKLNEVDVPKAKKGQVLVRMHASPINPSDLSFLKGLYAGVKKKLPATAGFEGSGKVVAYGGGILGSLMVGKRVACSAPDTGNGTWAEYMLTSVDRCIPLEKNVTMEQGAMLIVNPLTVWGMIETAKREGHKAIVQTAAASALGKMLIRTAKQVNIPTINIVRRSGQVEDLKAIGAEHILNSSDQDFDKQLQQLCTKLHATFALEAIAGEMTGRVLDAMPVGSHIAVYGGLSEEPSQVNPQALIFGKKKVRGFWLPEWLESKSLWQKLKEIKKVQALLGTALKSEVRKKVDLKDGKEAIKDYMENMTGGKVLITM